MSATPAPPPSEPEIASGSRQAGAATAGDSPTRRERAAATGTRAAMSMVRLIALVGIVGLAIIAGAIMTSQDVEGWIEGLVIGAGAVILSSIVFLSRRLGRRV
jgi:hypothetical protein